MDLTIGSFNFRVRSLGSVRLSDPINLGSSARKPRSRQLSIKPTKSKGNTIEELDEIMETLDLEESPGYLDMVPDKNLGNINNHSEEDFIAYRGDVSGNSEDG
jgi:hypothetical protein